MSTTRKILSFIGLPLLIVFAAIITWSFQKTSMGSSVEKSEVTETTKTAKVQWTQDASGWNPDGVAPKCTEPFKINAPTDIALATSILYPGQERGGDYKPHGGFRFDNSKNEDITTTIPIDANLVSASRYLVEGEIQYSLNFITPCGISYLFDHIISLTPKLQQIVEKLPDAKEGDSRTTNIVPQIEFTQGEVIANSVGIKNNNNVFFDFGVYDLRKESGYRITTAEFLKNHKGDDNALNGICWFDFLSDTDSALVKSLPGSGETGKTSDTCN